jgi:hypothetical protein
MGGNVMLGLLDHVLSSGGNASMCKTTREKLAVLDEAIGEGIVHGGGSADANCEFVVLCFR